MCFGLRYDEHPVPPHGSAAHAPGALSLGHAHCWCDPFVFRKLDVLLVVQVVGLSPKHLLAHMLQVAICFITHLFL